MPKELKEYDVEISVTETYTTIMTVRVAAESITDAHAQITDGFAGNLPEDHTLHLLAETASEEVSSKGNVELDHDIRSTKEVMA